MAATVTLTKTEELLGDVFSAQSVLRCYKQDDFKVVLETVPWSRAGGWCEMAASPGVNSMEP
jgi:hypothetical protein